MEPDEELKAVYGGASMQDYARVANDYEQVIGKLRARIAKLEGDRVLVLPAEPTLRDRFAMAALTGMIAARPNAAMIDAVTTSKGAYILADAMLRAREEKGEQSE